MKKYKSEYFIAVSVCLIVFLTYLKSLGNEFVLWDDDIYVYANPGVWRFDMPFIFRTFFEFNVGGNWHPLTMIAIALDCAI